MGVDFNIADVHGRRSSLNRILYFITEKTVCPPEEAGERRRVISRQHFLRGSCKMMENHYLRRDRLWNTVRLRLEKNSRRSC